MYYVYCGMEYEELESIVLFENDTEPYVEVYNDGMHIGRKTDDFIFTFGGEEIEEIYKAYITLKNKITS